MPQIPRWRGWWNEARVVASSGGGTPVGGRGIPHSRGCRRLSSSRRVQGMAAPQSRRSCCHFTTRLLVLLVLLVLLTAATVRGERVPPSPERICTPRRARVVFRKVGLWWVFLLSLPLGCSKRHQRKAARMHTTAEQGRRTSKNSTTGFVLDFLLSLGNYEKSINRSAKWAEGGGGRHDLSPVLGSCKRRETALKPSPTTCKWRSRRPFRPSWREVVAVCRDFRIW